MLDIIRESSVRLATEFNDFWLLAGVSDWSFEEGIRGGKNKGFAKAVDSFQRAGVPNSTIAQLRDGINGNLAAVLEGTGVGVNRNIERGQDIELHDTATRAVISPVEVKYLFDCTYDKYYPAVAEDRERVRPSARRRNPGFQVVFFVQLPNFLYPRGRWYGSSKIDGPRPTNHVGIQRQFRKLMSVLPHPPTWPENGPYVHALKFPTEIVTDALLLRRYAEIFTPAEPWTFTGIEQLRDAKVGVAVWQVD